VGPDSDGAARLGPGVVVLVPFPFTDLSGTKRRTGLVVSPARFHPEDLILCAITSQVASTPARWEVALEAAIWSGPDSPSRA